MSILSFIGDIFKPAADLVDELNVSDEERGQLKNELAKIQGEAQAKILELEKMKIEALSKVQVAEAGSKYFLTANWRPLCAITLVGLIIAGSFELCTINDEIYDLVSIFLGVYTGSRGLEKISNVISNVIKLGGK